jgi:rhodanese-related sulfurtransferase
MKKILSILLAVSLGLTAVMAYAGAVDPATVPKKKQTTLGLYLTPKEAHEMKEKLGNKALMVDVRTPAEIFYLGMANDADMNIPYMLIDFTSYDDKNKRYTMSPNSGFTLKMEDAVKKAGLDKNSTIILSCRSGDRSANAADLLHKAGYTKVYSIVEGFEGDMSKDGRRSVNGWKNDGLPWTYDVAKSKLYIE